MISVTIDRKHWWRGHDNQELKQWKKDNGITSECHRSLLLGDGQFVPEDQMCCLGHISLACGCTKDQIRGVTTPHVLTMHHPEIAEKLAGLINHDGDSYYLRFANTTAAIKMMIANDNPDLTAEERESIITKEAESAGYKLTFV